MLKSKRVEVKDPNLKPYIDFFWEVRSNGEESISNTLLPRTRDDLILYSNTTMTYSFEKVPLSSRGVIYQGPRTRSIELTQKGNIHIVGATIKRFSSSYFIDKPLKNFVNSIYVLSETSSLLSYSDYEVLLNELIDLPRGPDLLELGILESFSSCELSIQDFCKLKSIGIKRLERLFTKYKGLTPKVYKGLERGELANNTLLYSNVNSLTELSYNLGFFDQTHMVKEFRKMHNRKPKEFLKDNFTIKSKLHRKE